MAVFVGANFVTVIFLTLLPSFLYSKFHMSLSAAGLNGTAYLQIASLMGVISGAWLADSLARRRQHGRMMTQTLGLFGGVPFLFLTGWTDSVVAITFAMAGFGLFKGLYDANLWASLYDVVPPERRAAAVSITNSLGWLGGGVAPVAIAAAAQRYGMGACISATSMVYFSIGILLCLGMLIYTRRSVLPGRSMS
jgi:sugar phosphate permease